jgi:hypothetical protein
MDTDKHGSEATTSDDPRIKRVLKRYLRNEEFSDATMDLSAIPFVELQKMCHCSADKFQAPLELDGLSLVNFTNSMGVSFDAGKYDYFVHSYARREFCSSDRVPPQELHLPCEDGPPTKIPLAKGLRWVSARPKDGLENFLGVENEDSQSTL